MPGSVMLNICLQDLTDFQDQPCAIGGVLIIL